jgi:protein-tyrosine-phosphatase
MLELGVDLAGRVPQPLTDELAAWADVVVTMGCGDARPYLPVCATSTGSSTIRRASVASAGLEWRACTVDKREPCLLDFG